MFSKFQTYIQEINWKSPLENLYSLYKWLSSYIEYAVFILLIMFKLYLFASLTNTVFYETGAGGFLENIYLFLFKGQTFNYLTHGLVMISLGFLMLLTFWTLLLKRKARIIVLLIVDVVLTFIIYADLVHVRYFGGYTSVAELIQVDQVADISGSIMSLLAWSDLVFWVDMILLIPIVILLIRKVNFINVKRRILGAFVVLFIGWFSLSQAMFTFYYDYGGKGVLDKMINDETIYNYVGLLGYHYFDAQRFTKDYIISKRGISDERNNEMESFFAAKEPKIHEASFGQFKGKNLIVVQVEALQNFIIDRKVNDQEITPFLNNLKEKSIYFNNFFHQAGQGRTSDADLLVNASLHPLSTGSVFTRFAGNEFNTISSSLKNLGYGTSVHHAFKASFWNRNNVYPSWNYDEFYSKTDYGEGEAIGWGLGDNGFLSQSIDMFPKENAFYSFLITLTSHHPYHMPEKYQTMNLNGIESDLLANYLHSTRYVDDAIENFVERLKAEGLWEESIVVFYGDHDANVLEKGATSGLFATEQSGNPVDYLMEKDSIPLIIHLPNDKLAETKSTFGGQIDVAPTLLHLLGVETKNKYFLGEDLLVDEDRHPVVFNDRSVTNGELWYLPSTDSNFKSGICYDLNIKEKINVNKCRDIYEIDLNELNISEGIILGNWLEGKE